MNERRCGSCVFWDRECQSAPDEDGNHYSWCERFPPVLVREPECTTDDSAWAQPFTAEFERCGEWQPRPNIQPSKEDGDVRSKSLRFAAIPERLAKRCALEGVRTIGDLCDLRDPYFRNCGHKTMAEALNALREIGVEPAWACLVPNRYTKDAPA